MVRRIIPALVAALLGMAAGDSARAQPAADASERAPKHPSDQLATWIDERFAGLWKDAGLEPREVVDDATFLRRVYLDLVGSIPSVAQTRDFLADESPSKRSRMIEQLLAEPRSSAHLARVFQRIMVPNGSPGMGFAPQFGTWLQQQFAARVPYDKMVRTLVTANPNAPFPAFLGPGQPAPRSGSAGAFYRAVGGTPDTVASSMSRVFLGVRIGCAKCHNHPFAEWRQDDFWGMAAFFASAPMAVQPNAQGDTKAEDTRITTIKPADSDKVYTVRLLWSEDEVKVPNDKKPRQYLADWLVSKDNPNFAATAVNRVWQQLCGQGLIPHVDDLDQASPKQRNVVLNDLARQFVDAEYDVQWLISGICKSRVYQRPSATGDDPPADSPLSIHRPLKSLSPQQVFDSLEQALMLPVGRNDAQSARYNSQGATLMARLNEASSDSPDQFKAGIPQALAIMNGVLVSNATDLDESRTLRAVLDAPFLGPTEKIETLYLATLTRKPDAEEVERLQAYLARYTDKDERRRAYTDIYWALLNNPEFILSR
ncbi:MAG: DUF1549 domain-containing protein [Planctomycetia bacterium]|nr:DUF1549 domain-containing protein [Planctomycetia bacterium]